MHKLYELKDMLCEELESYGSKDKLDVGGLEIVDKLAHAIKNIDKIIECEEGYSNMYDDMSHESRRGGRNQYGSYARGRRHGSYAMDGYSRTEGVVEQLRGLMEDVSDPRSRQEIQRIITKMEQM